MFRVPLDLRRNRAATPGYHALDHQVDRIAAGLGDEVELDGEVLRQHLGKMEDEVRGRGCAQHVHTVLVDDVEFPEVRPEPLRHVTDRLRGEIEVDDRASTRHETGSGRALGRYRPST